jgi:hypothetical protein
VEIIFHFLCQELPIFYCALKVTGINNLTRFQATEAYSSLNLAEVKYYISRWPTLEKETIIEQISPSNSSGICKRKFTRL